VSRAKRRLDRLVEVGAAVLVDGPTPVGRDRDGRIRGRESARYALATLHKTRRSDRTHTLMHTEARATLDLDVSAGRTEKRTLRGVDLETEDTSNLHTENT